MHQRCAILLAMLLLDNRIDSDGQMLYGTPIKAMLTFSQQSLHKQAGKRYESSTLLFLQLSFFWELHTVYGLVSLNKQERIQCSLVLHGIKIHHYRRLRLNSATPAVQRALQCCQPFCDSHDPCRTTESARLERRKTNWLGPRYRQERCT